MRDEFNGLAHMLVLVLSTTPVDDCHYTLRAPVLVMLLLGPYEGLIDDYLEIILHS